MQGCAKDLRTTGERPAHWPGPQARRGRVAAIPPPPTPLRRNPSRLPSPLPRFFLRLTRCSSPPPPSRCSPSAPAVSPLLPPTSSYPSPP